MGASLYHSAPVAGWPSLWACKVVSVSLLPSPEGTFPSTCCSVVVLLCLGPRARSAAMNVKAKLAWVCLLVYSERIRANLIWLGSISSRGLVVVWNHRYSEHSVAMQPTSNAYEGEG